MDNKIFEEKNILYEYIITMGYTDIMPVSNNTVVKLNNYIDDIYNNTNDIDVNKLSVNKKRNFIRELQKFIINNNTIDGLKDNDIILLKTAYESYVKLSIPVSELTDKLIEDMYSYLSGIVKETKYNNLFNALLIPDNDFENDISITNKNKYYVYSVILTFNKKNGKYIDKKITLQSYNDFYELELYIGNNEKFKKEKENLLDKKEGIYELYENEILDEANYSIKFLGIIITNNISNAQKKLKQFIKNRFSQIKRTKKLTEGLILEVNIDYKNFIKLLIKLINKTNIYDMSNNEREKFFKCVEGVWDARRGKPYPNYKDKFIKCWYKE